MIFGDQNYRQIKITTGKHHQFKAIFIKIINSYHANNTQSALIKFFCRY
jgi:hypothetical protein